MVFGSFFLRPWMVIVSIAVFCAFFASVFVIDRGNDQELAFSLTDHHSISLCFCIHYTHPHFEIGLLNCLIALDGCSQGICDFID